MSRPSSQMRIALVCGLAFVLQSASLGRAGEIASLADEHGHKIFVNAVDTLSVPEAATRNSLSRLPGTYALHPVRLEYAKTPPTNISTLVEATAGRHKVDPKLVHAIIQVESGYNTRALSRKGARGLMQLIPATASRFGVRNSFNPKQNIEGGVTYLKYLLDLFGGSVPLSVAAYNAGENAVLRKGGIPAYTETVNYVQRVTNLYHPPLETLALTKTFTEPAQLQIYRLVDARGVAHYTNDGI